jgi:hippurate hydrolase
MASADIWTVEIQGRGGHGAMPHLSVDPITVAANILLGMNHLVAREVPAQDTAVLTAGQIVSGTKSNIIPAKAVMTGTLRAFDAGVRAHLLARLGGFVADIARAYRAEARLVVDGGSCPAVINHGGPSAFVRRCAETLLGDEAVAEGPLIMASDDMSLFLEARTGCYFRVGVQPAHGHAPPHHAPEFEMNEDGLLVGLRVALEVMRRALEPLPG